MYLVCRLLLEKKKKKNRNQDHTDLRLTHIFLFCASGLPRHFPPFPTRRSSDLAPQRPFGRTEPFPDQPGSLCGVERRPVPLPHGRQRRHNRLDALHGRDLRRDRKSTRLNSSHRCISYAVFCLKKKKKKTETRITPTSDSLISSCFVPPASHDTSPLSLPDALPISHLSAPSAGLSPFRINRAASAAWSGDRYRCPTADSGGTIDWTPFTDGICDEIGRAHV